MRRDRTSLAGPLALASAIAVCALILGALIFAWSGLYSIAASKGHWPPVKWFLEFGMQSSVRTHAFGIDAPAAYSDDQAILGAGHYHTACASCHGAPGVPIGDAAKRMLPPPPDLAASIREWRDRELFWIVKNGIKYTGMPGWVAESRDDEVWTIVAFLKRYPSLDAQGYRRLAFGSLPAASQSGAQVATIGAPAAEAAGACARCHGSGERGPTSKLVPALHGQPRQFLVAALEQFSNGARASGIMQPIAAELSPDAIEKVVAYYAALPLHAASPGDEAAIARGRALAESGDQAARIPACAGCHGASALPVYPRLAGQNAAYMASRLKLWKQGLAATTNGATIMAPIARMLTGEQIGDLAAFYASQTPHAGRP